MLSIVLTKMLQRLTEFFNIKPTYCEAIKTGSVNIKALSVPWMQWNLIKSDYAYINNPCNYAHTDECIRSEWMTTIHLSPWIHVSETLCTVFIWLYRKLHNQCTTSLWLNELLKNTDEVLIRKPLNVSLLQSDWWSIALNAFREWPVDESLMPWSLSGQGWSIAINNGL